MQINYEIIEHREQRYDTVGDYWIDSDGVWQVRVSRMSDPRYMELVFQHELFEGRLFVARGGTIEQIDSFDMEYERCRREKAPLPCGCAIQEEPGDDPHCPVYREHQLATAGEIAAAEMLDVDWDAYRAEVRALEWKP